MIFKRPKLSTRAFSISMRFSCNLGQLERIQEFRERLRLVKVTIFHFRSPRKAWTVHEHAVSFSLSIMMENSAQIRKKKYIFQPVKLFNTMLFPCTVMRGLE